MRVLITNGYIVYYLNVVAFKTEIYDGDDDDDDDYYMATCCDFAHLCTILMTGIVFADISYWNNQFFKSTVRSLNNFTFLH